MMSRAGSFLFVACVCAAEGCALHDFEVGASDATTDATSADAIADQTLARHDVGVDAHKTSKHDAKPSKPDATPDAKPKADTGAPMVCASKTYPPPPGGVDLPGPDVFTLAVRSIDLGESDLTPPGYNLDYTCTCIDDGGPSCVSSAQHCDYAGGIDNGALGLLEDIELVDTTFGSVPFSQAAAEGGWSLLFQLTGYAVTPDGGVPDDPVVDLNIFVAQRSVATPPSWNGTDEWIVAASSVVDGGVVQPRYKSAGAYVNNHVLVAAIPEMEIVMSGGTNETITFRLSAGFLTGTLDYHDGAITIHDGIVSARWAQADIFAALGSYRNATGTTFCTDNLFYPEAKAAVCSGQDILVNGADPASLPCDALSMGVGFTAFPIAQLSVVGAPTVPSAGCPAATDPTNDSCGGGRDAGAPDAGAAKDAGAVKDAAHHG